MKKINKTNLILSISMVLLLNCKSKVANTIQNGEGTKVEIGSVLNTLFKKGDYGYACFRIPAIIVSKKGSILAFAEARKQGCSDTGNIDLVMRKSTDNGQTWGVLKVIWDDSDNVCGNPAPVVDEETGTIHLLSTWNNGMDHESHIIEGTSKYSREIFHQFSEDDGESWSVPKKITKSVKLANWTWYATGPVHGIQLKKRNKGRLIIPCDHIELNSKKYFSHVIYSDNNGATWKLGGTTPFDKVNECTIVELQNGDLMLNMRNYDVDSIKGRQIALSKDGGMTWYEQFIEEQLPEPICQGAMISIERDNKNILLFTNPSSSESRENMTLSISRNNGESWYEKVTIFEKNAAYSDLAEMKDGKIIVCFEAGIDNPYEGIYYKTLIVE